MRDEPVQAWVCAICGYVHYGPEPPEECPVCGADASQFEPEESEQPARAPTANRTERILIIGAGIAGVSAAEAARKAAPQSEIWLVSGENDLPYYRLNLTRYLAGEVEAGLLEMHPASWYENQNIRLLLGLGLSAVDTTAKKAHLSDGSQVTFDRLVLATGASPFLPPVPGARLGNVTTLRTRGDAQELLAESRGKQTVCIGGGILGLETAGALARQGVAVTVLENQAWLMPRQLNRKAAGVFQTYVTRLGIRVLSEIRVEEVVGQGKVESIRCAGGLDIPAEYVVFSAGVRPNIQLAQACGLQVNQGILVDDRMCTSHPDIFAAGDAAEHAATFYGTWAPAQSQGAVAGTAAAGGTAQFHAIPRTNTLKVLGIDLFSAGKVAPEPGDMWVEEEAENHYTGFLFHQRTLCGAILLGDASQAGVVKKAVENQVNCTNLLAQKPSAANILDFLFHQV
jgi:nitrite reductase (NADH) large subunit